MKKVRYMAGALGAVGVVPAALGLTALTANATTQPAGTAGKTVALLHPDTATHCNARSAHTSSPKMRGYIAYSRDNGCIGSVVGHYYGGTPTGYDMRVRFYPGDTTRYVGGTIHHSHNSIVFRWSPYSPYVSQVCEAIVNSNKTVVAGPVCETTGY